LRQGSPLANAFVRFAVAMGRGAILLTPRKMRRLAREGQGAFRVRVLDAYDRGCSVPGGGATLPRT